MYDISGGANMTKTHAVNEQSLPCLPSKDENGPG